MQQNLVVERSTALPTGQRLSFAKTKADGEQVWLERVARIADFGVAGVTLEWYVVDIDVRNAGKMSDDLNRIFASLAGGPQAMVEAGFQLLNYLQASSDPGLKAKPKPKRKAKAKAKPRAKKPKVTTAAGIRLVGGNTISGDNMD